LAGTRIRQWVSGHRDQQAVQYDRAVETLSAAGYTHYEVSNFCLPGREGRQNLLVWNGAGYLVFGPGAHSYVGGQRWANVRHLSAYRERVARGERPIAFEERLSLDQQADEAMMLGLRQGGGLDVAAWEERHSRVWGTTRARTCEDLAQQGLAEWTGANLRLRTRGMLLADEITARLAG
jgi:oxygen-independent coproporphyrinogen-3 oxidase